jgi:hypothetical protein
MKQFWILLLIIPILACNFVIPIAAPTVEVFPPSPLPPSPTPSIPLSPTASSVVLPSTNESPPSTFDPNVYGVVRIEGNPEFITQTQAALSLLEIYAPDAYQKIQTYVGLIQQGQHSGMWAWEEPPRYEVGDATAFYSVTWYASTIAHDSTHSELYHQYLAAHPGEYVPDDVWSGVEIERFCNGYQLDVLKRIGGPQSEIDYLASLDGTHCDVDNDGDCDWDDYNKRDW